MVEKLNPIHQLRKAIETLQAGCDHDYQPLVPFDDSKAITDHKDSLFSPSYSPPETDATRFLPGAYILSADLVRAKCTICEFEKDLSTSRSALSYCPNCLGGLIWLSLDVNSDERLRFFGAVHEFNLGHYALYRARCHKCGKKFVRGEFVQ